MKEEKHGLFFMRRRQSLKTDARCRFLAPEPWRTIESRWRHPPRAERDCVLRTSCSPCPSVSRKKLLDRTTHGNSLRLVETTQRSAPREKHALFKSCPPRLQSQNPTRQAARIAGQSRQRGVAGRFHILLRPFNSRRVRNDPARRQRCLHLPFLQSSCQNEPGFTLSQLHPFPIDRRNGPNLPDRGIG